MRNGGSGDETVASTLVEAARAGDRAAVAELVETHLPLVYNLVGRALDGRGDVDDVVQECMVRVIRGLPELREPDRFRSWLVSITYRQIRDHWRATRHDVPLRPGEDHLPDPGDLAERTVSEVVLHEQRQRFAAAAHWLDADDRACLALWWQQVTGGVSRTELAAAWGVSEATAAVRLHRLRTRLDSLRAVVAALHHRPRCPELAALTRRWDGSPSPLWRKRLTRHVRDCRGCTHFGRGLVPLEHLVYGVVALPVSVGVAAAVRAAVDTHLGVPGVPVSWADGIRTALNRRSAEVAVAAVVVAGVLALAVWSAPVDRPADPVVAAPVTPSPSATGPPDPGPATGGPTPSTSAAARSTEVHVATDGSDDGDGSPGRPFATLNRAADVVRPGQTIVLRGGTYRLTRPVRITTSGTADRPITLRPHRRERVVLDAGGVPDGQWAVTQRTDFWTVQDLTVRGSRSHAWVCTACTHTTFRRLSMHDNARSGLLLRDPGTIGNRVLDNDFFGNHDPDDSGSVGIGLGVKFGSGEGNVIRGNRAFHNADDGFDFGDFDSPLTVEGNWAFGNGQDRWGIADWASNGYGFSLGGGPETQRSGHRLRDNAAWGNRGHGFGAEANRGRLDLVRNTAVDNGGAGFDLSAANGDARANLAVDNERETRVGPGVTAADNSWDAARSTLRSTDPTGAEGDRPADGGLPPTDYLDSREEVGARMSDP
ncbi:sigma-70 family RNA polymerase sigma factor [Micromonospora sp. SH-82]|uniref:sigma-70 family RNA polymerase sigma factor n=1 Tax=Micromonospora sp. SH-82 TaxID=3132938 RepID=UPI003EB8172D